LFTLKNRWPEMTQTQISPQVHVGASSSDKQSKNNENKIETEYNWCARTWRHLAGKL